MTTVRQQHIIDSGNDSFEKAQAALVSGKKREPDYAAIERHRKYQSELRSGQSLVRFFLGRLAMLMAGVVVIAVASQILDNSYGDFGFIAGIALLILGVYLVFAAVFSKIAGMFFFFLSFFE